MLADDRLDRRVTELVEVGGAHVVVRARGPQRVEQALHRGVGHDPDEVDDWVAEVFEGLHQCEAVLGLAGVDGDDRHDRLAVHRFGEKRRGRSGREIGQRGHLVGQLAHPVAIEAQHLFGAVAREEDRASQQHRADRMQPELKRGRDTEVPPAAA